MKTFARIAIIVAPLILMVICLFFKDHFVGNNPVPGSAAGQAANRVNWSHAVPLTFSSPTTKVLYCFDKVEQIGKSCKISGWAFLKGMDAKGLHSFLLLKNSKGVVVFTVEKRYRKDVTKALGEGNLDLDSSGFSALIPTPELESVSYQLGLYLLKEDKTGLLYTEKNIQIKK